MKKEMIKPSAIVAINADLTLIERQLWNILFSKAYPKIQSEDIFYISIQDILVHFPYETKNYDHIKGSLEKLVGTTVKYDYLGKDKKNAWGVFALLASANLEAGICKYSYAPTLREQLNNEFLYAKVNLHISMRFASKYALILYELCCDFKGVGHKTIFIEDFRDLMGLQDGEYKRYKDLNYDVIQKAVKEINEKSNLHVEIEPKRTGRCITSLKFLIGYNTSFQPEFPLFQPTKEHHVFKIKNMLQER